MITYSLTHTGMTSATAMPNTAPLPLWPVVGLSSFSSAESIANFKTNLDLKLTKVRRISDSDRG